MTTVNDDPIIRGLLETSEPFRLRSDAPVSEGSIKSWCGALNDRHPAYLDEVEAIRLGYGGIMAPPIMMHSYTLPTLLTPEGRSPSKALRARMAELGYPGVAAVNYEQEYELPIRIGDLLMRTVRLESLSDAKTTALGTGHFLTTRHDITNQNDEQVGRMLIRVYYFRAEPPQPRSARPPAAENDTPTIALPPERIPITATLVVAGALASLDFELVHHDRAIAQAQGMQDVFMNILTSSGLAARYVHDWAGYEARITRMSTRLHSANFPGDTMKLTGFATAPRTPGGEAVVRVQGSNSIGKHLDSEFTVRWHA